MAMQPESEVRFEVGRHHDAGGTKARWSRLAVARLARKAPESMRICFERSILSRYVLALLLNNEVVGGRSRKRGIYLRDFRPLRPAVGADWSMLGLTGRIGILRCITMEQRIVPWKGILWKRKELAIRIRIEVVPT